MREAGCGVTMKWRVADHWTFRDDQFRITGWHWAKRRKSDHDPEPQSGRGVFVEMHKPPRRVIEQGKLF